MIKVLYDGSFAGLLTAIFEVYEYKLKDVSVCRQDIGGATLFHASHLVYTNIEKTERVWRKLESKISSAAMVQFYRTFLSEEKGMEDCLLRYTRYVLLSKKRVENDFGNPDVLKIQQLGRKVFREKHRMEAFVRFQLTRDGLYYCVIQPDYNVLPLILKHFKERYADQRWLIYDIRRKYGMYYDLRTVEQVELEFAEDCKGCSQNNIAILDEQEELCQQLWRQYFTSVNIPARKNMKLHIRHMPKRYWRYLTEKNGPKGSSDMQFL